MPPRSPQHDSDKFEFEFDLGDSGAADKAEPAPEKKPEDEVIHKPRARQPAAPSPPEKKEVQQPASDDVVIRRSSAKPSPVQKAPSAKPRQAEPPPEPAPQKFEGHTNPVAEPQTEPVAREIPASLPPVKTKRAAHPRPVPNPAPSRLK